MGFVSAASQHHFPQLNTPAGQEPPLALLYCLRPAGFCSEHAAARVTCKDKHTFITPGVGTGHRGAYSSWRRGAAAAHSAIPATASATPGAAPAFLGSALQGRAPERLQRAGREQGKDPASSCSPGIYLEWQHQKKLSPEGTDGLQHPSEGQSIQTAAGGPRYPPVLPLSATHSSELNAAPRAPYLGPYPAQGAEGTGSRTGRKSRCSSTFWDSQLCCIPLSLLSGRKMTPSQAGSRQLQRCCHEPRQHLQLLLGLNQLLNYQFKSPADRNPLHVLH